MIEAKLDELTRAVGAMTEGLSVVGAHARILERHENEIGELLAAVRELDASVRTVIANYQEMNQLLASIHSIWANLDCVRPPRRRPSSSEIRAIGGEGK